MDQDEIALYDHMLAEYRQALSDAQFALVRANSQLALQKQMIHSLTAQELAGSADGLGEDP